MTGTTVAGQKLLSMTRDKITCFAADHSGSSSLSFSVWCLCVHGPNRGWKTDESEEHRAEGQDWELWWCNALVCVCGCVWDSGSCISSPPSLSLSIAFDQREIHTQLTMTNIVSIVANMRIKPTTLVFHALCNPLGHLKPPVLSRKIQAEIKCSESDP